MTSIQVVNDPAFKSQVKLIAFLSYFRTFSGSIIKTGIAIFILSTWTAGWPSDFFSGLSISAIALTYMFSPIVFGQKSDKIGRRRSLLVATGGNVIIAGCLLFLVIYTSFSTDIWLLIFIICMRATEGLLNGFFWPILQASVADASIWFSKSRSMQDATTKSAMGIFNLGWNAGILSGEFFLSMYLLAFKEVKYALIIASVLHVVNFIIAFLFFKQYDSNRKKTDNSSTFIKISTNDQKNLEIKGINRNLTLTIAISLIFILLYGFCIGGLTTTTTNLYKFLNIAYLLGITEVARISVQAIATSKFKFKGKQIEKTSGIFAIIAGMFVLLSFTSGKVEPLVFLGIYSVLGFLLGICYAEPIHIMASIGDEKKRGFYMGLFEAFIGIGFFIGPLFAGFITENVSYQFSYLIVSIILIIIIIVVVVLSIFLRRNERKYTTN